MIISRPSSSNSSGMEYLNELRSYLPPYRSLINPLTRYDYKSHKYIDSSIEIQFSNLFKIKQQSKENRIPMKYRSLLSPLVTSTRKRILDVANDSISIKSFKSSKQQKSIKFVELPNEVLLIVFSRLDQASLVNLLYANKKLNSLTKIILYKNPYLTSTYRLGQFVYTINNNKQLAMLVKVIDLSNLRPGVSISPTELKLILSDFHSDVYDSLFDREILAGWRDWRYRDHPLYGELTPAKKKKRPSLTPMKSTSSKSSSSSNINSNSSIKNTFKKVFKHDPFSSSSSSTLSSDDLNAIFKSFNKPRSNFKPIPQVATKPFSTPHPKQSKFLNDHSFTKDIPIGYILHILQECENLNHVNLNGVSCSPDFQVLDYEYFNWKSCKGKLRTTSTSSNAHGPLSTLNCGSLLLDDDNNQKISKSKPYSGKPVYWSDALLDLNESINHVKLDYNSIWFNLIELKHLRTIDICSLVWLDKHTIYQILKNSNSKKDLIYLNCNDSGMKKNLNWASKKTFKEWKLFFKNEYTNNNSQLLLTLGNNNNELAPDVEDFGVIGHEYY